MDRRGGCDFDQQFLHVEIGRDERLPQPVQGVRSVSQKRLLHDVMKQLLDERVLRLFAADGEFSNIMRAGQPNFLAVIGHVFADRIDWPIMFAGAEAAHGVKLFQAEPERVDYRMTALACL